MRCIDLSGLNLTQFSFLISDSVFPSLRELVLSDNTNLKIGACTKLAVLKVSQCQTGSEMAAAFHYLGEANVVAALDGEVRPDRAPKGKLQPTMEAALDLLGGGGRSRKYQNNKASKKTKETRKTKNPTLAPS